MRRGPIAGTRQTAVARIRGARWRCPLPCAENSGQDRGDWIVEADEATSTGAPCQQPDHRLANQVECQRGFAVGTLCCTPRRATYYELDDNGAVNNQPPADAPTSPRFGKVVGEGVAHGGGPARCRQWPGGGREAVRIGAVSQP